MGTVSTEPIVKILLENEIEEFPIPKGNACRYSFVLRQTFETEQKTSFIIFDNTKPAVQSLVSWLWTDNFNLNLHHGGRASCHTERYGEDYDQAKACKDDIGTLINLWIIARNLHIFQLQNAVMSRLFEAGNKCPATFGAFYTRVYSRTIDGSPLREFIMNVAAWGQNDGELERRPQLFPRELLLDLTNTYSNALPIHIAGQKRFQMNKNFFMFTVSEDQGEAGERSVPNLAFKDPPRRPAKKGRIDFDDMFNRLNSIKKPSKTAPGPLVDRNDQTAWNDVGNINGYTAIWQEELVKNNDLRNNRGSRIMEQSGDETDLLGVSSPASEADPSSQSEGCSTPGEPVSAGTAVQASAWGKSDEEALTPRVNGTFVGQITTAQAARVLSDPSTVRAYNKTSDILKQPQRPPAPATVKRTIRRGRAIDGPQKSIGRSNWSSATTKKAPTLARGGWKENADPTASRTIANNDPVNNLIVNGAIDFAPAWERDDLQPSQWEQMVFTTNDRPIKGAAAPITQAGNGFVNGTEGTNTAANVLIDFEVSSEPTNAGGAALPPGADFRQLAQDNSPHPEVHTTLAAANAHGEEEEEEEEEEKDGQATLVDTDDLITIDDNCDCELVCTCTQG